MFNCVKKQSKNHDFMGCSLTDMKRREWKGRFSTSLDDPRVGGLSKVYKAVDLQSSPPREVAVKVLEGNVDTDPIVRTLFDREVDSLLTLEHPNIVQLIDADVEDGQFFVVLEWIENDLKKAIRKVGSFPWEDFFKYTGLPVLSALAFAHERKVIHRDVKPANVLLTRDGVPKLADFGIAKIKNNLTESSATTIDFLSRPFSPPELDTTFSRDVFGFGVLTLAAISGLEMKDYPDIEAALESVDLPNELHDLLRRCVSLSPNNRPPDAVVLLDKIESLLLSRKKKRQGNHRIHLSLDPGFTNKVTEMVGLHPDQIRPRIIRDLNAICMVRDKDPQIEPEKLNGRTVFLTGEKYGCQATIALRSGMLPALQIELITSPTKEQRERAFNLDVSVSNLEFSFEPPLSSVQADAGFKTMVEELNEKNSRWREKSEQQEDVRLLNQWKQQIDARQSFERMKQSPIRYLSFKAAGNRIAFEIEEDASSVSVGEFRTVELANNRTSIAGEVEIVQDGQISVWFSKPPQLMPERGRLLIDIQAAEIKLQRERKAVNALINHRAALLNPNLRDVVIDPTSQSNPDEVVVTEWLTEGLDQDKRELVKAALGSRGMFVVEGPPGTGKTTFIAELVAQTLKRKPESKILISSQTNIALDNALERIGRSVSKSQIIRFADREAAKVSETAQEFLLRRQVNTWCDRTLDITRKSFTKWAEGRGLKVGEIEQAWVLKEWAHTKENRNLIETQLTKLRGEKKHLEDQKAFRPDDVKKIDVQISAVNRSLRTFRSREEVVGARLQSLFNKKAEEIAKLSPSELIAQAQPIFQTLGDDVLYVETVNEWITRLESKSSQFEEAVFDFAHVMGGTCIGIAGFKSIENAKFDLCIVDEASKATATETLVPLIRAKRWVLVGDHRQLPPFQEEALSNRSIRSDFNLDDAELGRTLFDRMKDGLPEHSKGRLTTQRRMTESIGNLISECFYDGELISKGPDALPSILQVLPLPITWWSTSKMSNRYETRRGKQSPSFTNSAESQVIKKLLKRLEFCFKTNQIDIPLEIAILAPYSAQVAELRRQVASEIPKLPKCQIQVDSVDAVQGREADLVIFSTVRSNPNSSVGFLNSDKRANVALSRARRGLILVGDFEFMAQSMSPFQSVANFIINNPASAVVEDAS